MAINELNTSCQAHLGELLERYCFSFLKLYPTTQRRVYCSTVLTAPASARSGITFKTLRHGCRLLAEQRETRALLNSFIDTSKDSIKQLKEENTILKEHLQHFTRTVRESQDAAQHQVQDLHDHNNDRRSRNHFKPANASRVGPSGGLLYTPDGFGLGSLGSHAHGAHAHGAQSSMGLRAQASAPITRGYSRNAFSASGTTWPGAHGDQQQQGSREAGAGEHAYDIHAGCTLLVGPLSVEPLP